MTKLKYPGLGDLQGVAFPAIQVPSADPNTLDDYEEGTWTPVLGGDGGATGQTYLIQKGAYTKIGRLVVVSFEVKLSAKGTPSGTVVAVTGLPFPAAASLASIAGSIGYAFSFASSLVVIGCYVGASSSIVAITGAAAAGVTPMDNLAIATLSNTTYITGSVTYFT